MRDVLALLTAGVGVVFVGLHLISTGLQESSSRSIRAFIRRSTSGLLSCSLVGIASGAVMQSSSAVTTVLGSMATSGLVSLTQALPIVAFANVGTTALVFAGAVDIHLAVMFAIGLSGLAFSMAQEFRWKAASGVALGIALLLYGGDLMTQAASGVQSEFWFAGLLRSSHGSTLVTFLLGVLASFLSQSSTAVALLSVAMADARLLDLGEATTMIYGANLGSTITRYLMTQRCHGVLRQISRFQDLFKATGTAVFVLLFVAEHSGGVPLVNRLAGMAVSNVPLQLALINLLLNGTMALLTAALRRPIEGFVRRRWPSSSAEELSIPEYVSIEAAADPATAIDLLEKEQMRILERTRDYLSLARRDNASPSDADPVALHRSFAVLFGELELFHGALVERHIDANTSKRLGNAHGREKLVELVETSLQQLASSILAVPAHGALESLTTTILDALDFLLMFAGDAARTLDRGRAEFLFDLTSDRGEMMSSIRAVHMSPDRALTADERALLLRLTNLFERIVWMLQRYADLLLQNVDAEERVVAAPALVAAPAVESVASS